MTKEQFLSNLEKKLSILEKSEIKDIIDEYNDIILEKVKNGKTEQEAIEDFGEINELVNGILKAYKINPEKHTTVEDKINRVTNKISETIEEVSKSFETKNSNENIFIKIFLFIILSLIALIPFGIIDFVLDSTMDPFLPYSIIIDIITGIPLLLIYIVIVYFIFKKIFHTNKITNLSEEKNLEENIGLKPTNNASYIKKIILIIITIPLALMLFSFGVAITVLIFLAVKYQLDVYAFITIIISLIILSTTLLYSTKKSLENMKPKTTVAFIVSFVIFLIGFTLLIFNIVSFKFIDSGPTEHLNVKKISYEEKLTENIKFENKVNIKIDDNLEDLTMKTDIEYYPDIIGIKPEFYYNESRDIKYIKFTKYSLINNESVINIALEAIDNYKNKKIYDYSLIGEYKITITTNNKTSNMIKR